MTIGDTIGHVGDWRVFWDREFLGDTSVVVVCLPEGHPVFYARYERGRKGRYIEAELAPAEQDQLRLLLETFAPLPNGKAWE